MGLFWIYTHLQLLLQSLLSTLICYHTTKVEIDPLSITMLILRFVLDHLKPITCLMSD